MLVLTRKIGEALLLGDNIEIKILDSRAGRVRVGIDAPVEVPVVRKELREADIKKGKDR